MGWSTAPYISLNFDPTLNIAEQNEDFNSVSIYPNPASSDVTISFDLAASSNATIKLSDLSGKILSISAKGASMVEESLYLIHIVDWASFYLCEANNQDIIDIEIIDYLKGELSNF